MTLWEKILVTYVLLVIVFGFIGIGFILGGSDFGIYFVLPMIITIGLIILYSVIHTIVAIWKSSPQSKRQE